MSEGTPATHPDPVGVVDPIRIPGAARGRRAWAGLPNLAKVFVALVAIDVIVRALGLFGTSLFLDLGNPLSVITAFVPHDALILLPAVLVWRRADAVEATPLVMRGAMLVALVELLNTPLRGLLSGNPLDPIVAPTVISVTATLLMAAGWILLAFGLRELNPATPEASNAGLANIVGGAIAVGAIVSLASVLLLPAPDIGEPTWNTLVQLNSAMFVFEGLALAYLARIVVLGTGDVRRPIAARNTATGAMVLLAIGRLAMIAIGPGPIWLAIVLITGPVAMTAFVVAFGLGLADAPARDASERGPSGTFEAMEHASPPTTL
jgi:hypothetical protein